MKRGIIVLAFTLCFAVIISGTLLAKGKPDTPSDKAELIEFAGDLTGSQIVTGGFPNAGPFPDYTMTLSGALPAGAYDGKLHINIYMADPSGPPGKNKRTVVKFWWSDGIGIRIVGGVKVIDRKTKIETVTFQDEICEVRDGEPVTVSFVLTRIPQ